MADPNPSRPPAASPPSPVVTAIGWLFAVLGGAWTALTGLCTGTFVVIALSSPGDEKMVGLVLFLGGIGIAPGALMLWGGIAIIRSQRRLRAQA